MRHSLDTPHHPQTTPIIYLPDHPKRPASSDQEKDSSCRVMADHVYLDGRTLEGGGQLVRNALALSALTGRPVTIDHVRGSRQGKRGLKGSHAAAVKLLAEISGSKVVGGEVGSQSVTFIPPSASPTKSAPTGGRPELASVVSLSDMSVQKEYNINLPTAGSVFLVFQALYPYLLHVGLRAPADCIRVNITGGTNSSFSPSYDYASQVMMPNFARLRLPHLSMKLNKRGWSSGPVDLGSVSFRIHPLTASENIDRPRRSEQDYSSVSRFRPINLLNHERGKITQIDITILAPDSLIPGTSEEEDEMRPFEKAHHKKSSNKFKKRKWKDRDSSHYQRGDGISNPVAGDPPRTIRNYIEDITIRALRNGMETLDPSIFESNTDGTNRDRPVPVTIHTSEATFHRSHKYILIVAHTSTGFRIGHDTLYGFDGTRGGGHATKANKDPGGKRKQDHREVSAASGLVNQCVRGFVDEISGENHGFFEEGFAGRRSCLDVHMRDQVVVFEALGELARQGLVDGQEEGRLEEQEDESHWSLHTKTARWVCRQMLGESVFR
ncbi:hypothetical protein N7510_003162 [Penicillium lagena]|uniref:uncharacterized protein n=1 Tax=Penicillium lagena TaxID=94218 RepID=UPI002540E401|nr:uncharacterized protein N7510_003162 [Penicillium lagena]KAJ5619178.1 hypothetical protein N7510_003162 [Penicillium lagena]